MAPRASQEQSRTLKWTINDYRRKLRLWYYQYEVTLGLYVMTPGEQFVVNFIMLTFLALLLAFITLWLPWQLARTIREVLHAVNPQIDRNWDFGNDVLLPTVQYTVGVVDSIAQTKEGLENASIQSQP